MEVFKVIALTVVWVFIVIVNYMIGNLTIFGVVEPTMREIAFNSCDNETGGYIKCDRYLATTHIFTSAFNVSCAILLSIPFVYLFVRLLFKKESQTQPQPSIYQGGF